MEEWEEIVKGVLTLISERKISARKAEDWLLALVELAEVTYQ